MKKSFKTRLFGYRKSEVNDYIDSMVKDYEDELKKKQERMWELNEENRNMRTTIQELEQKIKEYLEEENYISKALVKAEEKAQTIIDAGHKTVEDEMRKLEVERRRWQERSKEIRKQLMDFENMVYNVMESFRSEINYLASKEISESIIEGQGDEENSELPEEDMLSVS